MRMFWRILGVLGAVVLLLLVAVAVAVHSVDVREFVGPIQKRVKDATGRDLEVRGGIELKLGLEPKLVLDDVSLGNASWGKQAQMLTAKQVEAQVALLPLLRRHFEITRFKLIAPTIALETDATGKGNWEFPGPPAALSAGSAQPSGGILGALTVVDFEIAGGAATYRDGKTGEVTNVVIDDLSVHARDPESAISGTFRGKVNDTAVSLEGDFGPLRQIVTQRWPYPVAVQGEIGGKKASVGTQVSVSGKVVGLDELKIVSGSSTFTGTVAIVTGSARPKVTFSLAAPSFASADFVLPLAGAGGAARAHSKYLFSEQPVDVAALRAFDAEGELSIGALTLDDGVRVDQLHVKLTLSNGRLEVPLLQGNALGGAVNVHLQLDAARGNDAALVLHADARNLDLGSLLAAAHTKRELRGGKTEIRADISAHGDSPRQWASSASGNVLAVTGPATLVNPKATTEAALDRLFEAVNPFRHIDPTTELHCAVIRLPLKDGVAAIDRSIAVETDKLGATASGTVDLRSETLDLSIKPQIRQGVTVAVPQVASLVHFSGPLTAPTVGVDATATAATVARIGAAVYTGGLSIIGESLFKNAEGNQGAPCQIALGHGAGSTAAAGKNSTASNPAAEVGKAVGHLFGH